MKILLAAVVTAAFGRLEPLAGLTAGGRYASEAAAGRSGQRRPEHALCRRWGSRSGKAGTARVGRRLSRITFDFA
ncbi:MAG: hypothetical protein WAM94_14270, partial [Chromatiaceae bacterium]